MNIELENNSAPSFIKFLNDRDIEAVAFDIDNTLIATSEYYDVIWSNVGIEVAKHIGTDKPLDLVGEEYREVLSERYKKRNRKPEDIVEQVVGGLEEYFGYITDDMRTVAANYLQHFYTTCPTPYDESYVILKMLNDYNKKIVFCSHAQECWTKIKADFLGKGIEKDIPYLAVDIDGDKNAQSWINSASLIDTHISKTLVIGDTLTADILPAIEAGCKHVIWIDKKGKGLPEDIQISEDVELIILRDIRELIDI